MSECKCTLQGQKLMMIGTADEIVKAPEKGTVFVEDLPEEEQVAALVRIATSVHSCDPYYHSISYVYVLTLCFMIIVFFYFLLMQT